MRLTASFAPISARLARCLRHTFGQRVNVWRIGRASSIWSLTGNSSAIESLRFGPTEEFLVSGSAGGAVKLFDLSAGKMTRHFRGHMSNVTVIDCGSFDRRFVTTGSMDCQVC